MPIRALDFWTFGGGIRRSRPLKYPTPFRHPGWRDAAAGLTYCRYRTFQRFCNCPMSVINDRLRGQTHALPSRAHIRSHSHSRVTRTARMIRISYIALVNYKHTGGEWEGEGRKQERKQSRITVPIILNRIEFNLISSTCTSDRSF